MNASQKLDTLKDAYGDDTALDLVLDKLLDARLSECQLRLERYERALREYENHYAMDSKTFYQRFEAGTLGDAMDFFDWAGLYELYQDVQHRVQRLEQAL